MSQRDARIQVAIDLFKAWSSDDGVAHEVDYHDRVNVPLSLGVKP